MAALAHAALFVAAGRVHPSVAASEAPLTERDEVSLDLTGDPEVKSTEAQRSPGVEPGDRQRPSGRNAKVAGRTAPASTGEVQGPPGQSLEPAPSPSDEGWSFNPTVP